MESNTQQATSNPPPTPNFQIPVYVLDDLCSRFIINIPEEERQDLIRIFFQIELAHWFYLDFYCAENPELKTCGIKDFSAQIFRHCPPLNNHAQEVDKILGNWKSYKMSVPTFGAIMLDPDMKYCLLVQGFWAKASWGFPKGKVNAEEEPWDCAIREVYEEMGFNHRRLRAKCSETKCLGAEKSIYVYEETGFDVSTLINREEFLENKMNDQVTRLYIIQNVPLDTKFQPKTRKEIKSLQWFPLESLPSHKRDQTSKTQLGLNPNTFFMVIPFVKQLKKWVSNRLNQSGSRPSSRPHGFPERPPSHQASERPLLGAHGTSENFNKTQKDSENCKAVKQYHDKQKIKKQQQYFEQMNQNEYQEYMQFKDSKTRAREARERKQRSDGDKGINQGYGSPSVNNDKKQQFHILNRDGTVGGKPRRSLATQFDNQGATSPHQGRQGKFDRRNRQRDQKIEHFVPQAWSNFKLDVDAIMACIG